MLDTLTQQLETRRSLSPEDVTTAVNALVDPDIAVELKARFLSALALKGETVDEIAAFASRLRDRATQPELDTATRASEILDVCGTGGDRLNTFNISTTVSLVAAAAGIPVAKHGNRAITSNSGSADVLEALGVRIDVGPDDAGRWLRDHHFVFLFAPAYHPAFRHIGPARKLCAERGQRTIFNFLGPLLNPVRPTAQLIGVPRPELCEPVAKVLQSLGARRGMVVSGAVPDPTSSDAGQGTAPANPQGRWLDELSILGPNRLAEFHQERAFSISDWSAANLPLCPATLADLAGGDREANAAIVRHIVTGIDRGPRRDAILLNSAAALFIGGRAGSIAEGWDMASELIDRGAVRNKLQELVEASQAG
jgi:anthranilate phosphoribosyltransferase